jgi:hypothetical protein
VRRAALKCKSARLTPVTNVFSGKPARGIINLFSLPNMNRHRFATHETAREAGSN